MPVGADPHSFQPSAQQIALLTDADAVIINGGGFEGGLLDIIEAAEADGTLVFEALSAVETLSGTGTGHNDHSDDDRGDDSDHEDEEHHEDEADHDDHGDDHGKHGQGGDPHFFTDPVRMAAAAEAIGQFVVDEVEGIDTAAVRTSSDGYQEELAALDAEIIEILSAIAPANRLLVTNHQVLSYFADRYDFEVIGTVIPGTTVDSTNAAALSELAAIVELKGIPAVFSDTSSSDELAQTLALEAGSIEVYALYSESLGPADSDGSTYIDMIRTNAQRIAKALAG